MKQKNPNSNACCRYVVDDVGDARRAPQGVIAVLSQFFTNLRDKKHPKCPCFWRLTGQKPRYRYCFCYCYCYCCCCCCCCPCSFFLNLVVAENRQIGCVFHFVKTLGAKNTVNTDVFCASEAQNHRICDVFCFW